MSDTRILWLSHHVTYRFETPPGALELTARLLPPSTYSQEISHPQLLVEPRFGDPCPMVDGLGNAGHRLQGEVGSLRLLLGGQARVAWDPAATGCPRLAPDPERAVNDDPVEVIRDPTTKPLIQAYADQSLGRGSVGSDEANRLMTAIRRDFAYDRTATDLGTSIDEFFRRCRGVCDDFVSLAGYCLGLYGVPTHRVVGYLVDPRRNDLQSRRMHAWIAVWFDGLGWVEFDPTTGHPPPTRHITLLHATGRSDGVPVRGRVVSGQPIRQSVSTRIELSQEFD